VTRKSSRLERDGIRDSRYFRDKKILNSPNNPHDARGCEVPSFIGKEAYKPDLHEDAARHDAPCVGARTREVKILGKRTR